MIQILNYVIPIPVPVYTGSESSCSDTDALRIVFALEIAMFLIGLLLWLIGVIHQRYSHDNDDPCSFLGRALSFTATLIIIFTVIVIFIYQTI